MANTYDAVDLCTPHLVAGSVTPLQNRWAALQAFSLAWQPDNLKPKSVARIKFVTGAATPQTDPSNFESGDSTVDAVSITPHLLSLSFNVSNDDLQSGLALEDLIERNRARFADFVIQAATAPITEANFANYAGGSYVKDPLAFSWSDMSLLWSSLAKADEKHAILDGPYLGPLVNTPTFFQPGLSGDEGDGQRYGWRTVVLNTNWSGAGAGCRGFVCHKQAIGVVCGLPAFPKIAPPNLVRQIIDLPTLKIQVESCMWLSLASRSWWASFGIILGSAKLDGSAGIFIKAS